MDYLISGDICGVGSIGSYSNFVNIGTLRAKRSEILGECAGIPGVRIKLDDLSDYSPDSNTTSIGGIVGHSNKGPFNTILKIRNSGEVFNKLKGFQSYKYNQGLYSAMAVLENGGFVEYVRPYSEEIILDSTNNRELKSDVFVISYDYNQNTKRSILIDYFSSTRYYIDGYSTFGNREILNIQDIPNNNYNPINFSLQKSEDISPNQNKIALFSIINLDPSIMKRSKSDSDFYSDRLLITTANYIETKTITQNLGLLSQPTDGDIIYLHDHSGNQYNFEFDNDLSVNIGNIQVTIGGTLSQTIINLLDKLSIELPNISFSVNSNTINATMQFGIHDVFVPAIHDNIFKVSVDVGSVVVIETSIIENVNILIDDSIGRLFLSFGCCNEIVKTPSVLESPIVQYALNERGVELSKIFVLVDYILNSEPISFYGTIKPHVVNEVDLFIENVVNSSFDNFKVMVNSHEDLTNSISNINFNLGQSIRIIEVRLATTTNVALNGLYSIDGVFLNSGDIVLVKDQTITSKNGLYVVSSGIWSRYHELSSEFQFNSDIYIEVLSGILNSNTKWKLSTPQNFKLGLSGVSFYQTNQSATPVSSFLGISYNQNDPAIINNSVWIYDPKKQSQIAFKYAWGLFLDKSRSNCDYLIASGTNIKNLFVRGLEELDSDVMKSMLDVCNYRKDCFCLFDGVDELNIDSAVIKMANAGAFGYISRWGAIFDGRSHFMDTHYTKMDALAVKSIELASIITRNRRGGLFWIPPAGKDYGTVSIKYSSKPKYTRRGGSIEDPNTEIGKLYGFHINPSRFIDGLTVIFGEKTLFKENNICSRLHVTMLISGLHKKLQNILDPRMLKLNTLKLRNSLKEEISLILNSIKRNSPSGLDRYDIICDSSNNTRQSISEGKLIVDIKIYPTKTSECIILRTTVERTDRSLSVANFELVNG